MENADSFRINIAIEAVHLLTDRVYVGNAFQNTNTPINEIVCVIQPPYYIDWFEISYPILPFNIEMVHFVFNSWM